MKAAGSITGTYNKAGQMVFQQEEIEEAVLDHFTETFIGQRSPVYPDACYGDIISMSLTDITNILAGLPTDCPEDKFEMDVPLTPSLS